VHRPTQRDSPEGSMRRDQHAFRPEKSKADTHVKLNFTYRLGVYVHTNNEFHLASSIFDF